MLRIATVNGIRRAVMECPCGRCHAVTLRDGVWHRDCPCGLKYTVTR